MPATARLPRRTALPVLSVLLAVLAAGCGGSPERIGGARTPSALPTAAPSGPGAPAETGAPAAPRVLARGLRVPWAIAFLPGGDALVTERDTARLLRVTPAGEVAEVGRIEGVAAGGEGGLMGVAVSPDYARDRYVFVYFTAADDNRVVRYRYDGALSEPKVLVSGIPSGGIHNGGRLAFGPDGYLYATTGEIGDRPLAQDRDSLGGKILRMTVDGEPAPGNPFPGSLVWSQGHRNVQGIAWDPAGNMYATEFGQNTFDEVNLIRKGANYGWPEVEGAGGGDRFADPLLTWSTAEASPSGMAYAHGSLWVAALRGARLWRIPVGANGQVGTPEARYVGEYGRLRAVATAPDGSLWVGTSNHDGRGDPAEDDDRLLIISFDATS